jgi:hypothetical protein
VFELSQPVRVTDPVFALKLRCLGSLRELDDDEIAALDAEEPEAPKAKRGRKAKAVESEASAD